MKINKEKLSKLIDDKRIEWNVYSRRYQPNEKISIKDMGEYMYFIQLTAEINAMTNVYNCLEKE